MWGDNVTSPHKSYLDWACAFGLPWSEINTCATVRNNCGVARFSEIVLDIRRAIQKSGLIAVYNFCTACGKYYVRRANILDGMR